ncbi:MAG: hypothetical protein ACYSRR_00655 [Planctomycetota bacterium]|jgi:RHS repeat-associated protein
MSDGTLSVHGGRDEGPEFKFNNVTLDGMGRLTNANETVTNTSQNSIDHQYTYSYDMLSQLIDANITNVGSLSWIHDMYSYSEGGNVQTHTTDTSAESGTAAQFSYDGDGAASLYFYTHDRLGSVRSLFDTDGDTQAHYLYDPLGFFYFGQCQQLVSNPFWFTGQWLDLETLQCDLRARQYNPYIGRFTIHDLLAGKYE